MSRAIKPITVGPLEIDPLTPEQAIHQVEEHIANHKKTGLVVFQPHVEMAVAAHDDSSFAAMLNRADLRLANGISLIWAAHYLHNGPRAWQRWMGTIGQIPSRPKSLYSPVPARIASQNFTWPLLQVAAKKKWKVFLIGSPRYQSIDSNATFLQKQLPGLTVSGTAPGRDTNTGTMSPELQQEIVTRLVHEQPNLVLIGLGPKRQEAMALALKQAGVRGVMVCEGGTFDYVQFGGRVKRAPGVFQTLHLEWLWRLIRQPSRIGRQLAIPRFMWQVYGYGKTIAKTGEK